MAARYMMSEADHKRVSLAVQEAESGTSGEIVTIISDASDRYQDVALWWSVTIGVLALAALAAFPDFYVGLFERLTGGWMTEFSLAEAFELALAVFVLKFAAMRLLLQWMPLRLFLTPKTVKQGRVHARALRYFKVGAERRTSGRTGILIFLSMSEHRAELVADEAIHPIVPAEAWGEAMAALVAAAREGRVADGMVAAIGKVGDILHSHFPRHVDDVNELPDRLIEL
jgi:putative membrane protein